MKLIKCLTNAPVAIALALTGGRRDRCGAFHDGYRCACWGAIGATAGAVSFGACMCIFNTWG